MTSTRRSFLAATAAGCLAAAGRRRAVAAEAAAPPNRIAVSTYSFWRFRDDSKLSIGQCIDEAAKMGFDGVEILLVQLQSQLDAEGPPVCNGSSNKRLSTGSTCSVFRRIKGSFIPTHRSDNKKSRKQSVRLSSPTSLASRRCA